MLRPRKTGWIGFDLGATSVKAAQVVRKGGEYFVRSGAIVTRPERWPADELAAADPRSSADEMRAFFEKARQHGLMPAGPLEFDAPAPSIDFAGRRYTFAWFALQKPAR